MHRRGKPRRLKPHTFKIMESFFEVAKLSLEVNKPFCKKGRIFKRAGLPVLRWNPEDYDNVLYAKDFENSENYDGKEINGTSNSDVIFGSEQTDEIFSGESTDNYRNGNSKNLIFAGGGDDVIQGDGGADQIYGQHGEDKIFGGEGDDLLHGGNGGDVIHGNPGDDRLYGGKGRDILDGGAGRDIINGGSEDDTITAKLGSDVLIGGEGTDNFFVGFERNVQGRFMSHRIKDFGLAEEVELSLNDELRGLRLDINSHDLGSQLTGDNQTLLIFDGVNQANLSLEGNTIAFV